MLKEWVSEALSVYHWVMSLDAMGIFNQPLLTASVFTAALVVTTKRHKKVD